MAGVRPSASTTSTTQPPAAGAPQTDPRFFAQMVSNITNALMEASAATLNPRTEPALVESLSARATKLQARLHYLAAKLDKPMLPAESMDYANDLQLLGAEVQDYVNAVVDAVQIANPGLQIAGLGATSSEPFFSTKNPKFLWIVGILAVTIGAGVAYAMYKKSPKSKRFVGKLPGAIPAK